MAEPAVWPLTASLVVASDIHLIDCNDERGRTLLRALGEIQHSPVDTFVLLGDIFDFGLGSNSFYQKKFAPIGEALSRIAKSGTRVVFVEGNHEFDIKHFPWSGVEFPKAPTLTLDLADKTKVALTHGDLLFPNWRYSAFRVVVKSRLVTKMASILPGKMIDAISLKSSEISRAQDAYRTINHDGILNAANNWLDQTGCRHGIFGHFHIPYAEPRRKTDGKVFSLNSWDKPNLLAYQAGDFFRIYLKEGGDEKILTKPYL